MAIGSGRGFRSASKLFFVGFVQTIMLMGCGGGDDSPTDTGNGVISVSTTSLNFHGPSPGEQTLLVSYVSPPTELVFAGYLTDAVDPACGGDAINCVQLILSSSATANPLIYTVSIVKTDIQHTTVLNFVSTDLNYQAENGYVRVTVNYTP